MKISEIIKENRRNAGISQLELAELAGVGKTLIFDVEKGRETISILNLKKIFRVLNIKMNFISPIENISNEKS